MYLNTIREEKIKRILDYVLVDIRHDEEWLESFPSVFGYEPFLPDSIEEAIEHPEALYSDDHAIAAKAILHPSFHPIMQEIVNAMIFTNIHWKRRDMEDGVEQPAISFARVLALYDVGYVQLYADFLLSLGDKYAEKYQSFDIVQIIRKWGWQRDTYYLMLTYWFLSEDSKYKVLDYLTINGFMLSESFDSIAFCEALRSFLSKAAFNEKDLSGKYSDVFENLLTRYIFEENEQMVASFKTYYLGIIGSPIPEDATRCETVYLNVFKSEEDDDLPQI